MIRLHALRAIRLVSADAEALAAFYRAIGFASSARQRIAAAEMAQLGLSGGGTRLSLHLGDTRLDIEQFDAPGATYPADARSCDPCFQHFAIRSSDAQADWLRARAAGATAISRDGAVQLPPAAGSVIAVKLRDPEGHPLEFLQFPEPRPPGIDHSAIAVRDQAASLAFYRDCGLSPDPGSLNRGETQARLDGLDRATVAVVPLLPPAPHPHLELLAYRTPCPRPASWRPNDVAATRLVWSADRTALIADPDGHLHQLEAS